MLNDRRQASTDRARPVGRWVVASAVSGTVMIGLGAFWLSFTALADLARRSGTTAQLSWVWPLIVDGVIVVATISVVALSHHGARATRYPWLLLAGGAAVSVSANVTHALVVADAAVPPLLAALVASVPPVVLLAITHLTVELTRYHRTDPNGSVKTPEWTSRIEHAAGVPSPIATTQKGPTAQAALEPVTHRPGTQQLDPSTASAPRRREGTSSSAEERTMRARKLRRDGLSNRRIATQLGVHPSTVGRWLAETTRPQETSASTDGDHAAVERQEGEPDVVDE